MSKERRKPNVNRSSTVHYPDWDKKKKIYIVPPNKRKINEMLNVIKSTPEYKLGKKLLNSEISKEDKTHTAGDIVYDNPLYDGEPTTADEYNNEWLNENKYNEIKELITDLAWEMDRMSSSGRSTLADLWKIFKIDDKNV